MLTTMGAEAATWITHGDTSSASVSPQKTACHTPTATTPRYPTALSPPTDRLLASLGHHCHPLPLHLRRQSRTTLTATPRSSKSAAQMVLRCVSSTRLHLDTLRRVGDAIGLQRELLRHGPVEVGLLVYLDFMHYAKGIYRRSPLATHPLGGHAVRLIGWGEMLNETTNESIPYWLAANSWSAAWGERDSFVYAEARTSWKSRQSRPQACPVYCRAPTGSE